jgi:uncharacterized protein YkwD
MMTTRSVLHSFRFHFSFVCFLLFGIATKLNDGLNDDVLKYTNEFRKSKRLTELVMRDDLNEIARKHSDDMAKGRCSFGHAGFNQRELEVQKTIDPFYGMAENVAYGATTAKEVVTMWKNSPEHRENMLGNYKYIGIGTAPDKLGRIYYTEIFVR